jgi:hypothetical protein
MQLGVSSIYFLHFPFRCRHGCLHSHQLSDYHHLPDHAAKSLSCFGVHMLKLCSLTELGFPALGDNWHRQLDVQFAMSQSLQKSLSLQSEGLREQHSTSRSSLHPILLTQWRSRDQGRCFETVRRISWDPMETLGSTLELQALQYNFRATSSSVHLALIKLLFDLCS